MERQIDEPVLHVDEDDQQPMQNAPSEATPLNSFDVFSLITNKMIGTGIYAYPSTVLLLTGDKRLSLGLWGVGFFYTIMSMFIYLDYAAVFPYTGGEIVYIDEITSTSKPLPGANLPQPPMSGGRINGGHINAEQVNVANRKKGPPSSPSVTLVLAGVRSFFTRLLGDGLMAYIVYAFLFVALFNSGTNVYQIGHQLLPAIYHTQDPNRDLIRFIGIFALSVICLIQLFSTRAGRFLNNVFAIIKILFLFILLCFGLAAVKKYPNPNDFGQNNSNITSLQYAQALMYIFYSFEGWENATFVAGEISKKNPGTLRKGFIWAVAVVGILYMALNAVFLAVVPYDVLVNGGQQFSYAAYFSDNQTSAQQAWAVVVAFSAAGNANTVIYTFTRVKQSIGYANILPWSTLWKLDYTGQRQGGSSGDRHKTPLGGLLLEWIATVIVISASAAIPETLESVAFPGNLQTYAHCFVLLILVLGLFRLRTRELDLKVEVGSSWFPRVSHWHWSWMTLFIVMYAGMNLFVLVVNGLVAATSVDSAIPAITGNNFPKVIFIIVGLGLLYYYGGFAAFVPNELWKKSFLYLVLENCKIQKEPTFDPANERTRRFGQRRIITMTESTSSTTRWFFYWFFGGRVRPSPVDKFQEYLDSFNQITSTWWGNLKNTNLLSAGQTSRRSQADSEEAGMEMEDRQ